MLVIEFNTGVFRIDLVFVHNANVGNAYGERGRARGVRTG